MVQGNDSLKVNSDTHLDDCASSSNDHDSMDAHTLNEELFMFCENLLSKYKVLKTSSHFLSLNQDFCFQNLILRKQFFTKF